MSSYKSIIFLITCLLYFSADAQNGDLYVVNIKGQIVSEESGEPLPYTHIINPAVHGGTTTNADGMFSIQMLTEDTLIIRAMGFVDYKFSVDQFPPKPNYLIKMKPVRFLINEVTVTKDLEMRKRLGLPDPEPLNIPTELRGDAFNEKPEWYKAFLSPLSYVQYFASKSEKEKRNTRQAIKNNEEWLQFSKYHNIENIKRLTGLHGNEADNFMLYCNINNQLPYYAGQMQIEFQIMNLFFKYKKEQKALK